MIDIHILNWNNFSDTKDCLKSIVSREPLLNCRLVVIDNNSFQNDFDNFVVWAESSFEVVIVLYQHDVEKFDIKSQNYENMPLYIIRNSENLGFAKGNNVGLTFSQYMNTELVLLLNNDTEIENCAISKMIQFLRSNTSYSVVTPQIRLFSNKELIWNCGGYFKWHGNRKYYYASSHHSEIPENKKIIDIEFVTGCCLMYRVSELGLLSDKFFFGEEDFEFSLRCKKLNKKIACFLDSVIYHKVGASRGLSENTDEGSYYLHQLQRVINVKTFYGTFKFKLFYMLMIASIIHFLIFKKKLGFKSAFSFINTFRKESKKITSIDKAFYLRTINRTF
jgi:GT2 family glycosyltransferase